MVLLFGSVARESAGLHSDIDLVAVFDDLDYAARYDVKATLVGAAVDAAGRDVDVIVSDRPEWHWRTTRVCSSLEAAIARDAVTLIDVGAGPVRWGKQIGLPTTNYDEVLARLHDARLHFMSARRQLRPESTVEWDGRPLADEEYAALERVRLRSLCADAALAIEAVLKAFRAAAGEDGPLTHHVSPLLTQTGDHREALIEVLASVRVNTIPAPRPGRPDPPPAYNDVGLMRTAGTYASEVPGATFERLAELAPRLCRAAVAAAALAAERLAPAPPSAPPKQIADLASAAGRVGEYLDALSVVSGAPHRSRGADI